MAQSPIEKTETRLIWIQKHRLTAKIVGFVDFYLSGHVQFKNLRIVT